MARARSTSPSARRLLTQSPFGSLPLCSLGTCVGSVDVTDSAALNALFREHGDENTAVWNLAAPLSVETAMDPSVAEAVTVGGMEKVLSAMASVGGKAVDEEPPC